MFITLQKFQDIFYAEPRKIPATLEDFKTRALVKTGRGELVPLKTYIRDKKVKAAVVRKIYDFIIHKDEYLERFYNMSLRPVPDVTATQPEPMPIKRLNNNTNPTYKNIIRNLHYLSILKKTESGVKGLPTYMNVLLDLLTKFIIDYKILTPAAGEYILKGRMGSVLSSFYFRASIMNPYLVYSIARAYRPARVFTPTLGWSSYLYGFLWAGVEEYVGTDVIKSVCIKTEKLAALVNPAARVNIYNEPSEVLVNSAAFRRKYKNHFDMIFFSPPYYEYEKYEGSNQSTVEYKTYDEWLKGYWEQTVRGCASLLVPGGRMIYITSGYENYEITKDVNRITKQFLKPEEVIAIGNKEILSSVTEEMSIFVK